METDEENAHTWRSLAWTAALLVMKLKTPEKSPDAEAPGKSVQRDTLPLARPPHAERKARAKS
jgi:hypothetical protein